MAFEQTERIPRCTGRKPFLSSEYPEIRLWILPLEKFLAFAWDKIPVFYDTWDTFFSPAIYWVILGKLPSLEILKVFGRFLLYGRETV